MREVRAARPDDAAALARLLPEGAGPGVFVAEAGDRLVGALTRDGAIHVLPGERSAAEALRALAANHAARDVVSRDNSADFVPRVA